MKIARELELNLRSRSRQYPAVAVVGPRQSGKTTLTRSTFPEKPYRSLEDLDVREFAYEDPRGFLANIENGAILDEVQRVPSLLSYIQTEVDRDASPGRFILTGSNQFLLMKEVSQSLAGRISIQKLLPFSYGELKGTIYEPDSLDDFLYRGAYPRIYDQNLDSREWLANYLETYVEKDLKDFLNVSDLHAFRKLLVLLAASCGQLLNLSSIGNSIGVSHNTIKAWIAALEASYLILLLQPYHKNFRKRTVKSPKIYFYDTGLVTMLLKLASPEQVSTHYLRGALFENWVIVEHAKAAFNRGEKPNLYFWRDHTGNEVDLLHDSDTGLRPIEIKSGQTIKQEFFSGLTRFCAVADLSPEEAVLIYGGNVAQKRSTGMVVPWSELPEHLATSSCNR